MAWRRPGDKPLSEAMLVSLLTHKCVTRPQWVKKGFKWCPVPPIKAYIHVRTQVWEKYSLSADSERLYTTPLSQPKSLISRSNKTPLLQAKRYFFIIKGKTLFSVGIWYSSHFSMYIVIFITSIECPNKSNLLCEPALRLDQKKTPIKQASTNKIFTHSQNFADLCLKSYPFYCFQWRRHQMKQMKPFSALLALCEGNPPVSGHQWIPPTKASDAQLWYFFLNLRLNNNRDASDLRRHRAHRDATVMGGGGGGGGHLILQQCHVIYESLIKNHGWPEKTQILIIWRTWLNLFHYYTPGWLGISFRVLISHNNSTSNVTNEIERWEDICQISEFDEFTVFGFTKIISMALCKTAVSPRLTH